MQKFIEKKQEALPALNVGILLGNKPTSQEVGIEIEVEGKNLLHEGEVPTPWTYHVDPSLRGEENAEYVLGKPIEFDKAPKAVELLFEKLSDKKAVFDDSNRTSVHVHMNCQNFHLNRLTSLMALWFALEEPLVEWCGEYRVGNLFCLRAIDAPAIITHLKKFIASDGEYPLGETLRYAAMNPNALHKYGSVEVRTLQGCHEAKAIKDWVSILARLYRLSQDFKNPTSIIDIFSAGGPMGFFKATLGDKAELVRQGCEMSDEQLVAAMFRGIRFAQQLAYCRDWDAYRPLEIKPDPFGRDARKIAPKIVAAAQASPEPEYPSVAFEPVYDNAPSPVSNYENLHLLQQAEAGLHYVNWGSDVLFGN